MDPSQADDQVPAIFGAWYGKDEMNTDRTRISKGVMRELAVDI